MPRQDVPYGGAICRLKERIAEIWDKLGEKLHSINGVEGDAAGDVKIVSGDAAIVVTSDQVNHQIEVGLDHAELPSAAVTSVNGETGAVVLDANDIDAGLTPPGTSVAQDLASTKQQVQTVGGLLQQEILDRQNADSALQGNINTLSASIPTAAATAVANDPTVAQLAVDVPNKVDKITSGSSLKAYTHTGATQGETSIVDGTTANSIGIRDANGRMQAADPANGATDKTLVTANWVSQTGESAPNNLLHTNSNELFYGLKTANDYPIRNQPVNAQNNTGWHLLYSWGATASTANQNELFMIRFKQGTNAVGILAVDIRSTNANAEWLVRGSGIANDTIIVARNTTNAVAYLFAYGYRIDAETLAATRATNISLIPLVPNPTPDTVVAEPTVGPDYDVVVKI